MRLTREGTLAAKPWLKLKERIKVAHGCDVDTREVGAFVASAVLKDATDEFGDVCADLAGAPDRATAAEILASMRSVQPHGDLATINRR